MDFEQSGFDTSALNEQQLEAVNQIEGPLLILAGPGSGKTRVITHRIANMIAHGIPSYHIAALTFTNKAAEEMRKRLAKYSPDNQAWTGTFHRFCSRLLRVHARMVGLAENFTIFDSSDSKKVMKQAIANIKMDVRHYTPDRLANEISSVKNAGVTVEQFSARPGHALDKIVSFVYPEYQKLLRLSNGVDFDDLLLHALDLLRQSPELRAGLDQRYAYMMVDEYQDTNTAQYQLIRMLNHDLQNLAVTGDPDQSIYGWRGANLNNILEFERDFPNVKVVRLEQNYRSTKSVLNVADQLIANNVRRKKKFLMTDNELGKPVRLVTYHKPDDESADIADTISLAIQQGTRKASDYAILYRTNYLSRSLEHAFRSRGLPYQIVRGHEFYQRKEIKDVIAYLQLLNNPDDGVAFERVVNVPPRKIGKVTLDRLRNYAHGHGLSMLEAARKCTDVSAISAAPTAKILKFVAMIDGLSEVATEDVSTIIKAVLEETSYRDWLTDDGSDEGFERANNVDELIVAAQEFERDFGDEGGLEQYLEQAALVSDTDAFNSEADYVTMMSLHAAKGLEFPCIFIIGLEEGILPHERSAVDEAQVEEERRLLFVGITRAESELQLSRCLNRFRRGSHWPAIPSRFLMELPRGEMDIFEPRSFGNYHSDEVGDALAAMDPFMNDGLPSIDINDDTGMDEISDSATNLKVSDELSLDRILHRDDDDDVVQEASIGTKRPKSKSADRVKEKKPDFPRLMTGAQLASEQEALGEVRLQPSRFEVGMEVVHLEYGIGCVISLQGEGVKRMATIDFPRLGRKRFKLAFTNLRAV